MGDTQHSLRIVRYSGRLPRRVPLRFPARAGGRLRPASIAAATLMIVAVLSLSSLVSSPAFALPAKAKAKLKIPHVPLAQVPWQRHFSHPTPIFIPPMSLPWADCHVLPLHIPHPPVSKWKDPDCHFIMAMCQDRQGNLWLATEGAGVYRYDPSAAQGQRWTQFTKQSTHGGLENNCIYAIACDNQDRIWVGELNHGISVFNGRRWQDYDIVQNPQYHVLAGPLGNHVYAMKFDRYTDQMWICTENGISVYQCRDIATGLPAVKSAHPISTHHWHYITQANGLPMNPDSIAFGNDGTIFVGTQCGGLAIGTPTQGSQPDNALGWNYYRWAVIKGPWHMPLTATGNGLPGNLVNSVVVTWKNHLAVGTDEGMALGEIDEQSDVGHVPQANLTFEHGQNFVAKVHGLWHPPVHWQAPPGQVLETLPTEDHTTAVAWEPNKSAGGKAGYLWLGHWRTGLDVWQYDAEGAITRRWHIHEPQVGNYIESLQPLKGGAMAVGCYGAGIRIITLPGQSKDAWRDVAKTAGQLAAAPEPHGARPPSERALDAMAAATRKELLESKGRKQPRIVPLPDDWRTEGNWLGRYGKYWIDLAAVCSPYDFVWGTGEASVLYCPELAYPRTGDGPRYWVQTLQTADPRALELPKPYMGSREILYHVPARLDRRDASVVDDGQAYPAWEQGPGLYITLNVPAGRFILSLYEWDDNAHAGGNACRDFPICVRRHPRRDVVENDLSFHSEPNLAGTRACLFYGGVWKRFLVRGPIDITVRISRNHSLNANFSALALDSIHQYAPPYFSPNAPALAGIAYNPNLAVPENTGPKCGALVGLSRAADRALYQIAQARRGAPEVFTANSADFAILSRVYAAASTLLERHRRAERECREALSACFWGTCLFERAEAMEVALGMKPARSIELALKWGGNRVAKPDEDGSKVDRYTGRQAFVHN